VLMRLPVSSAALLCRAVVRLTLREWLVALIGRDALLGRLVEAEATGLLPSRPRARRRIGISPEALRTGPRARRRIGSPSEAFRARPRARRKIGRSSEASRARPRARRRFGRPSEASRARPLARRRVSGLGHGRGLANSCLLALILTGSKRFFRFSLRGPLFMVPDSSPRASGRV